MPKLKSLLMLLVITVVAAGTTLYIKQQITTLPVGETITVVGSILGETNTAPAPSVPVAVPVTPVTSNPTPPIVPPQGIAPSLSGTLTAVNTGCFADGECSVTVAGKKVVLLIGWYQGKVGKILGADSIGDLENYIGTTATVYAGTDENGDYTLLGNEMFYIQVASSSKPVAAACVVGGCSSQLCGEESEMTDMVTTCEYQTKYSCYQKATCERQVTGQCGWTETPDLLMCLKSNS